MKGEISVKTQHIFPVIKRWLYSEKDIFIREIVSNSCDAITKHKRLVSLSQAENDSSDYKITVKISKDEKTITVSDNGIGMTKEEVENYINNIALSGALDFIEKYESADSKDASGIIGHFGLGFYSAFMVSDTVEILTRSYIALPAVRWSCDTDGSFEMEDGERETRGTDVIMHIAEGEEAYLDGEKISGILKRYCSFLPYPVMLDRLDGKEAEQINDTHPLWLKNSSEIKTEDYNEFYKKVFGDYRDPLFSVQINADYPLNFKGILFFPRPKTNYDSVEPQVKLYYNQVFVADNIKELIPEYLVNVKGVLDCPELPLNVSRSYLQTNTYVSRVNAHIVKKFADKLNGMYNTSREELEKIWDDCAPYIRYACVRDEKFFERVKDILLFKDIDGKYMTIEEYFDSKEAKGSIYYTSSKDDQAYYIDLLKSKNIKVIVLDSMIDTQMMGFLEQKYEGTKFVRVDSDISEVLGTQEEQPDDKLIDIFKKAIGKENVKVTFCAAPDSVAPAFLNISEQSRRFADMMSMYSPDADKNAFPTEETLVVNTACPMIKAIYVDDEKRSVEIARHVYLLALLTARKLTAEEIKEIISYDISRFSE
ncbi:MAG TPA: molecular chaperone HtpG [Bacillota bacterium]|nr:molecular chaperone HtpG [Bacillota bacterium]